MLRDGRPIAQTVRTFNYTVNQFAREPIGGRLRRMAPNGAGHCGPLPARARVEAPAAAGGATREPASTVTCTIRSSAVAPGTRRQAFADIRARGQRPTVFGTGRLETRGEVRCAGRLRRSRRKRVVRRALSSRSHGTGAHLASRTGTRSTTRVRR